MKMLEKSSYNIVFIHGYCVGSEGDIQSVLKWKLKLEYVGSWFC